MSVEDRLRIQEMIAQYSYSYDGKNADAFAQLFAEDGIFEVIVPTQSRPAVRLLSRSAIREWAAQRHEAAAGTQARHYQTGLFFDELTTATARTRTMLLLTRQRPLDAAPALHLTGLYHDTWRKTDQGWRLVHRVARLDRDPGFASTSVDSQRPPAAFREPDARTGMTMREEVNDLGLPVGFPVPGWTKRPRPPRTPMGGRFCRLDPLDLEQHAADLYTAYSGDTEGRLWTYLAHGPYPRLEDYVARVKAAYLGDDPLVYAVVDPNSGKAMGQASYLNIEPSAGNIEVGGIIYAPILQRTPAGTEAMYLMMQRVFDELGYRRYAWQCNALNRVSLAAAERLGFKLEGIWRQADVLKGRNRDTAWFSILDTEWPAIRSAFERWLDPTNFDIAGRQRTSLSQLRASGIACST